MATQRKPQAANHRCRPSRRKASASMLLFVMLLPAARCFQHLFGPRAPENKALAVMGYDKATERHSSRRRSAPPSRRRRRRPQSSPTPKPSAGQQVAVVQKVHYGTGQLTSGIVEQVLTRAATHPRGFKVRYAQPPSPRPWSRDLHVYSTPQVARWRRRTLCADPRRSAHQISKS